eukprot:8135270-Pyramimonas_sp.AAC.1
MLELPRYVPRAVPAVAGPDGHHSFEHRFVVKHSVLPGQRQPAYRDGTREFDAIPHQNARHRSVQQPTHREPDGAVNNNKMTIK